jgi:hypothetical protein
MKRLPTYTVLDLLSGALNMMHFGAALLAIVFLLAGAVLLFVYPRASPALMALAAIILTVQVASRLRHIRQLRTVREQNGRLQVYVRSSGRWVTVDTLTEVRKKQFPYADPWRPITVGYPGIELRIPSLDDPAEVLFPYGLEHLRDEVYAYLTKVWLRR